MLKGPVRRTPRRMPSLRRAGLHVRETDMTGSKLSDKIKVAMIPEDTTDEIYPMACYYFDGSGKSIRPLIVGRIAEALGGCIETNEKLQKVAMIAEMIHTGSLVHDDVIDKSEERRGKASANSKWGVTKAVMAGNYIISYSSQLLASLESDEVTKIISRIIEDLIYGELCQLESVNSNHEHRYKQYIKKTYLKTASLIANSAEAVAVLTDQPAHVQQAAFNFGKYLGIAFQIQDDRLDFLADSEQLGKPACADLKLGLSTAPVLYACQTHEGEMWPLMKRRFTSPGDVQKAHNIITRRSDALLKTRLLAENYAKRAAREIDMLTADPVLKENLLELTKMVTNRDK